MSDSVALQREALRQQQLLRTLWRRGDEPALLLWLRESAERAGHGLAAYRGNTAAIAERALAAAFPTVCQLIGDSFGSLARALWQRFPPQRGDLAQFGHALVVGRQKGEKSNGRGRCGQRERVCHLAGTP